MKYLRYILISLVCTMLAFPVSAQEKEEEGGVNISEVIFGHVEDSYEWHITNIGERSIAIPLPVIVKSHNVGWQVFSSHHLEQGAYKGL